MTGKEFRNIGDRRVLDIYMKSRGHPITPTDQNYVPRKQKFVKPAIKWKVTASKPKKFKFLVYTTRANLLGRHKQEARYSHSGTLRQKELRRNPNHISQLAILFLGNPSQKLERHKDLTAWDTLPESAGKPFQNQGR